MAKVDKTDGLQSCQVTCEPSKVINYHRQVLDLDGIIVELNLVTMNRSFLLQIDEITQRSLFPIDNKGDRKEIITLEDMIEGFRTSNSSLHGLSLATGGVSTCLVDSENDVYSKALATRLSTTLNEGRPVYLANNLKLNQDNISQSPIVAKIHMKIFDFVRKHYKCSNNLTEDSGDNKVNQ